MREPFLTQFRALVSAGAAGQAIHDGAFSLSLEAALPVPRDYVEREVRRVEAHRRALLPILEHFVGPVSTVLDVGCSTGGTTLALALSTRLAPTRVVGVDPNRRVLAAAEVRRRGLEIPADRVSFEAIVPNGRLPFADGAFDLTTCVSVLEFVSSPAARVALAGELQRVTRPGGWIFVSTPSRWWLRGWHAGRLPARVLRSERHAWSSTPSDLRHMFRPCQPVSLEPFVVRDVLRRRGLPVPPVAPGLAAVLNALLPWQKFLFRTPVA